jgi:divalent metal cation (Fe/Co/Zn/Cd) transporter
VEAAQLASASPEYLRLARRAKLLSWASLGYMALEGLVAIVAGIVAGSVALIGFGIDSAIEGFASVVIVWRFTGSRVLSEAAEHKAQRLVAVQFFILAPYVAVESVRAFLNGSHAETSIVGIALAALSLVVMPYLGRAKQRIGSRRLVGHRQRGQAEHALRLLGRGAAGRAPRQRARGGVVA